MATTDQTPGRTLHLTREQFDRLQQALMTSSAPAPASDPRQDAARQLLVRVIAQTRAS